MRSERLFYCGLLFSSLDSFPLFASVSTYGPYISVLFFLAYYISVSKKIHDFRFSKARFGVLLIILSTIIYSLAMGVFVYHEFKGFVNYLIQLTIAIVLYKSFNSYFTALDKDTYAETFSRLFIKASYAILVIGIVELLLFPFKGVYSSFVALFSWRVTPERIQLVSGEPAWATRFLLTYFALLPIARLKKKKAVRLYAIALLLLFATGSTLGLICVLLYFAITYFNKKYLKYYLAGSALLILMVPFIYANLNEYTKARIDVLMKLDSADIETIAVEAGSGSVMARLGNPVLAAYMGNDNFIMGVGGGYYYIHHYDYLAEYFPNAFKIKNIYETGVTAKNLFARIYAETGIIGIVCLICSLYYVYFRRARHNYLLRGVFMAMIFLTLNFDALFHIYPLLLFCFLLNYPQKKNNSHENMLLCK